MARRREEIKVKEDNLNQLRQLHRCHLLAPLKFLGLPEHQGFQEINNKTKVI
jgi:hypothetical protein